MCKFKFETGKVIEVADEHIIKLLRSDKRYVEIKDTVAEQPVEQPVEKTEKTKSSKKGGK